MKKTLPALCCLALVSNIIWAQGTFHKVLNKQPNDLNSRYTFNIISTADGGYAFTDASGKVAYVAKLTSNFNIEWARTFNNRKGHRSAGNSIAQSALDSSYCIIGIDADSLRLSYDLLISKLDKKGTLLSTKTYLFGRSNGGLSKVLSLLEGRFLAAVDNNYSNFALLSLDANGEITSAKSVKFVGGGLAFQDMIKTTDSGFIITGDILYNPYPAPRNIFCIKLDKDLNIQWSKEYASGEFEETGGILQTNDNGYFIYGSQGLDSSVKARIFKLDNNGQIKWHKIAKIATGSYPLSAVQCYDSGYAISCLEIGKLDKNGNLQWISQETLSGLASPVIETKDRRLVTFVQLENNKFDMIKVDSSGKGCKPSIQRNYTELVDSLTSINKSFSIEKDSIEYVSRDSTSFIEDTSTTYLCTTSVLPLKLLSFSAEHAVKENRLSWNTAEEINTAYFDIERSNDGRLFSKAGRVNSYGKLRNSYSFRDIKPAQGDNFYRLKMVDKDGEFAYSDVKKLNNANILLMSVYPNPANKYVAVSLFNETSQEVSFNITDIKGTMLKKQKIRVPAGSSITDISIADLSPGVYILHVFFGKMYNTCKVIKINHGL